MKLLAEKYEIIRELGHGAHSKVYLARHRKLDTLRAVKVVQKSDADIERYLHEANLIRNLKHPGIPIIYDIEEDEEYLCIIEEYVSGESLAEYVRNNSPMKLSQICDFGIQICKILEYLHECIKENSENKAVLHLDLKPENVMVSEISAEGVPRCIRLIDYDNAVVEGSGRSMYTGSKGFAAPEQYHRLYPEKTADIYGIGILLMYMSESGHIQSGVKTLRNKNLKKIIMKCIRHNPVRRYENAGKVRNGLQKILKNETKNNSEISLEINVAGTKKGIGTTHICLCMTAWLNNMGVSTVCVDDNSSDTFLKLSYEGAYTSDGTTKLKGAYLLPDYNEGICVDLKKYSIIIRDKGSVDAPQLDKIGRSKDNRKRLFVMVSGGKSYEEDELISAIEKSDRGNINCCILNHLSGRQFYSFMQRDRQKQIADLKYYRMPCIYDWHRIPQNLSEVFEELFEEITDLDFSERRLKLKRIGRWFSAFLQF